MRREPATYDDAALRRAHEVLRTKRCALLLGGSALSGQQLGLAQDVASSVNARVILETFPAIMDRGAGIANPERMIYLSEFAISQLHDLEALIILGSVEPVGFFAYPDVASRLLPDGCEIIALAPPGSDTLGALSALSDELQSPAQTIGVGDRPESPTGSLTTQNFASAVGATLREGTIVADESNTSGIHLFGATQFAPAHRWMTLTGGAIGYGLPVALGAAVASGERVLALESDGSMMYTLQALWTMAREQLNVTVVALSNRSYAILNLERQRVGAVSEGATSQRMLDLDDPALDLCSLARGLGVESVRVTTAEDLVRALERSYDTPGPMFIEAMLPKGLS
jgi:acetolactate synthase-1/2/3 large subunit